MTEEEYYAKKLEREIRAFERQEKENERIKNIPQSFLVGITIFALIIGAIVFKILWMFFDVVIFGIFS